MTIYEKKAPKPRRGVGSAAATRKWRMAKELSEMKEKRLAREKQAAHDYINRRKAESSKVVIDGKEWGRQVAFAAVDSVVAVARVADKLPDVALILQCKDQNGNMAYTDFRSVNITLSDSDEVFWGGDVFLLPQREDTREVLAEKIATIKGMAYHEIGHIKYTTRPWDLYPREDDRSTYFKVWNILEDQRMESWSVKNNARLGPMFTIMVSQLILSRDQNHWILVAGREYLPLEVQGAAYNSSPWDEDKREEWYQLVEAYKRAKSYPALHKAVYDAWVFLQDNAAYEIEGGIDEHRQAGEMGGAPSAGSVSPDLGQGDEGGEKKESPGKQAGKDAELQETDQSLLDVVLKAKAAAVEEFSKRSDVQAAVSRVADANNGTYLPPPGDNLYKPMEPAVQAEAEAIGEGMKRALSAFLTQTDPYWETHKETGVLDALAYRTKDPGSREFRRHRVDFNGKGRNVHVSLLCDISGSMGGEPMLALSMALYGTARACEELGIGNTLILWSTVYHQIWGDGDIQPVVWNSCGGTDPVPALDTIEDHNEEEADNHLVLVFTDGAWYNTAPLTTWGAPHRKIVVLHYGQYHNNQDLGADEEIQIDNVTAIPELLAQYIGDLTVGAD